MVKKIVKFLLGIIILALAILLISLAVLWAQYASESHETSSSGKNLKTAQYLDTEYLSEDVYFAQMDDVVKPYLVQYKVSDYISSDGLSLKYDYYIVPGARANICITHGLAEFLPKYDELIYYFLQNNYNVFILQDRDMGYSTRLTDNKSLCYVEKFDDYINDYEIFLEKIVRPNNGGLPLYLYSHSMGGAVAAYLLERHPNYFEKAVLSSPMMRPNTGSFPYPLAKLVSLLFVGCFHGKDMCLGYSNFNPNPNFDCALSTSKPRYDYLFNLQIADDHYQNCSPSYGWLKSATWDLDEMYKPENLAKIKAKCLVFKSDNDTNVMYYGIDHFVNNVTNSTLINVPNSKHEIYLSSNDVVVPYVANILDFFKK